MPRLPVKYEKVNDGKGRWLLIGNPSGFKNLTVALNGVAYLFSIDIGRLLSVTVWDKNKW